MLRALIILGAGAGTFLAGEAQAQIYPPAPVPYEAAYRGAPVPAEGGFYDDDDVSPPRRGARRPEPLYLPPADIDDPDDVIVARPQPPVMDRAGAAERAAGRYDVPGGGPRPPADLGMPDGEVTGAIQPRSESAARREVPAQFRRQLVRYPTREPAGTVIVDSANTYLYYVLGDGQAVRYGIGVGRQGFTWAGRERVSRMAEWPDWHPPSEMIGRQPYLPRFMAGGPGNPMGARALYLGNTIYRIHGTNEPHTIGKFVSSGCIRMLNEDVEDLYRRVSVGTQVLVLPGRSRVTASAD